MVTIYNLEPASEQCQWIAPVDPDLIASGALFFDGTPRMHVWKEHKFYVQNPLKNRCNFFLGLWGALVFDDAVMNEYLVRTHLELAGEILPIRLDSGEALNILNVTEVANALNHEATVFRKDRQSNSPMGVIQYAFSPMRLNQSSIFKVPETARTDVLTVSGRFPNPEDELYAAYSLSGLKGLNFREVWSGK